MILPSVLFLNTNEPKKCSDFGKRLGKPQNYELPAP